MLFKNIVSNYKNKEDFITFADFYNIKEIGYNTIANLFLNVCGKGDIFLAEYFKNNFNMDSILNYKNSTNFYIRDDIRYQTPCLNKAVI